jgi:hypothetical protein
MRRTFLLATTLTTLVALAGCGGGDGGGDPIVPPNLTAAELTTRGWTSFEAGDLASALADFTAAIARDDTYAAAYVGQGWAQLSLAATTGGMNVAAASFTTALAAGATGAEVRAGRAAAYLGAGGATLDDAATDAAAARTQSPSFQFAHRTSFDYRDLRLVEAFALAGQGDLDGSLAAADGIAASGITPGNSNSWVVDGHTYLSYGAAVLAYLNKLSNLYAG